MRGVEWVCLRFVALFGPYLRDCYNDYFVFSLDILSICKSKGSSGFQRSSIAVACRCLWVVSPFRWLIGD